MIFVDCILIRNFLKIITYNTCEWAGCEPYVVPRVSEVEKGICWGSFRKQPLGLLRFPTKNPAFI